MNQIDDAIRQALSAEDAKALERYATEPSLLQRVLEAFSGRLALLNALALFLGFALFGVGSTARGGLCLSRTWQAC